jgi:hypothetical protein
VRNDRGVVAFLSLYRWRIAVALHDLAVVEPVDPSQRGVLDLLNGFSGAAPVDEFCLVQAVNGLCQGIVLAVAHIVDGGGRTGLGEALCVPDGYVLLAPVGILHQPRPVRCWWRASTRASSTKQACDVRLTRQPTRCRAKTLMTKRT